MKKENALNDFIRMIKDSWTYEKMTKEERKRLLELLSHPRTNEILKGNYKQRYENLNAIYYAYLVGLGYDNFNWRESEVE